MQEQIEVNSVSSESIIAITSIIATSLVSIFSVFIPIWIERTKWHQERLDADVQKIRDATSDLLFELSNFFHRDVVDKEEAAGRIMSRVVADLLRKQFVWDMVVFSWLTEDEYSQVKGLAEQIKKVEEIDGHIFVASASREILRIIY